ncbi:MAG: hypothetical protein C0412_21910 [Flavobacterium sp.]|nr:hypothetical protein [Flavobacterium sp.]
MQTSVVTFQEIKKIQDFRIDAECFKPIHIQTENLIEKKRHETIGDLSESVINFGAYSLCNFIEFLDKGIPFIVTEDIKNNIIDTDNLHYVSKDVHKILYKSHCRSEQVLLTMAGAYLGQAAVYYLDFEASSNQAIAKITLKQNSIETFYLSTFLNCIYGQSQIERFRTGTGQPNLNLGLIQTIKIPCLNEEFQAYIKQVTLKGIDFHKQSKNLYNQAEQILLSELGLLNWKPKHRLSFTKNFSDTQTSERIDAEYFQPMYEEILGTVRNYKYGFKPTSALFNQNKSGFKIRPDASYQYVEISSVNTSSGENEPLCLAGKDLPANAKIKLNNGDLIISKVRTYRGAVAIVQNDNLVGSGAFTVLQEAGIINKETAYAYFKSAPILKLSLKYNAGTSYPVIDDKDILNLPFPFIPDKAQQKIKQKITEMYTAKALSKRLLDIAKRGVEMAIEKSEKESQEWISAELKKYDVKIDQIQ